MFDVFDDVSLTLHGGLDLEHPKQSNQIYEGAEDVMLICQYVYGIV